MATDRSWTLSFHGSEISRAWLSDEQDLHIAFSAASARQGDGTDGYLSGVTLVLSQAKPLIHASQPDALHAEQNLSWGDMLGGISEGHAIVQGQLLRQLPVPDDQTGPASLHLRLISGSSLSASGHSLRFTLAESARFRESWAC